MAGTSLVAERAGYELLGFDLEVLALTVAHFRFAGFAAALVTAMAATHGVANALGFGVCGLLAWKRLADERAAVPTPSP